MMKPKTSFLKQVLAFAVLSCGLSSPSLAQTCPAPASVTATTPRCDSVVFNWPAVTGVTDYLYAVNQNATYTGPSSITTNTGGRQGSLWPNTTYYVHVRSSCATTNSSWVRTSFTTPACPSGVCLAPNTVTVGTITNNSISYSWSGFPGAQGYEYVVDQLTTNPTGSGTLTTGTSITATGLTSGNLYYLHVRTKCGANSFSPWSNLTPNRTTGTDPNCPTPGPITSSFLRCDTISVSWPALAAHTSYIYSFSNARTLPPFLSVGMNNTGTRGNLSPSTYYYVQVLANCGMGRSATRIDSFLTPVCSGGTNCLAPASATITSVTATTMSASWSAIQGAAGYEVMLTRTATSPTTAGNARTTTTASATGLTPNTTYYFHVRTQCATNRFSPWRTPIAFTTPAPASVSNTADPSESALSVYPNPAGQDLTVELKQQPGRNAQLEVLSIDGKVLKRIAAGTKNVIATNELPSGLYLIRFTDETTTEMTRFVKQ